MAVLASWHHGMQRVVQRAQFRAAHPSPGGASQLKPTACPELVEGAEALGKQGQ